MKIKHTQTYKLIKLEELKYGDVFEYNEDIYIYLNPRYINKDCSDTTPILTEDGNVCYLCKSTEVIYYVNAELHLGNAYKG